MKTFSIAELERFTLIKAHTFRTWEQRFALFTAQRKATNTRFYTIEDLSFLLDFALLNRSGFKVSFLARLDKAAIKEIALNLKDDSARQERTINPLIIAAFSLHTEDFALTLDRAIASWGIDQTIELIILPFLERVELLSYQGRTASEYHFVVTALRKKLILAIEQTHPQMVLAASALLFLPEGEHFDLLLLYMEYKLRKAGVNVLYLGTNVTVQDFARVIQRKEPQYVVTYLSSSMSQKKASLQQYVTALNQEAKFIIGRPSGQLKEQLADEVTVVPFRDVETEIVAMSFQEA